MDWLKAYESQVKNAFEGIFRANESRFNDGLELLKRFQASIEEVIRHGRKKFHGVDEAHNELCVAAAILQGHSPQLVKVEYEPGLVGCTKSIDFRAKTADEAAYFFDVKTIKPLPKDRWEQYKRALKEGWFPENVRLCFSKEWLGGEFWHCAFAVRSRFLEYAVELEQKMADCKLDADNTSFALVLCGDGFHWHEDELEDFVAFYFIGKHRPDDPFAKAEVKYIDEKKLAVAKTITRFACLTRPQGAIHYKRLNWNVQPPHGPSFD